MPVPDGDGREGHLLLSLRRVVVVTPNVNGEALTRFRKLSDTIWHASPLGGGPCPSYGGNIQRRTLCLGGRSGKFALLISFPDFSNSLGDRGGAYA